MISLLKFPGRLVILAALLLCGTGPGRTADSSLHLRGAAWGMAGDAGVSARSIQFIGGGRVTGFGGCNLFSGNYAVYQTTLVIGPLVATRRACPEDVMTRETDFLKALENTRSAEGTAEQLVLLGGDRQVLATLTRPAKP